MATEQQLEDAKHQLLVWQEVLQDLGFINSQVQEISDAQGRIAESCVRLVTNEEPQDRHIERTLKNVKITQHALLSVVERSIGIYPLVEARIKMISDRVQRFEAEGDEA